MGRAPVRGPGGYEQRGLFSQVQVGPAAHVVFQGARAPILTVIDELAEVREIAVIAWNNARDADSRAFYSRLERMARWLDGELNGSNEPPLLDLPAAVTRAPRKMYQDLNA